MVDSALVSFGTILYSGAQIDKVIDNRVLNVSSNQHKLLFIEL